MTLPKRRVALIGNPNTGKSTVFNALAGLNARTGNYPGVTIEKKLGNFRHRNQSIELIDLPGTYSLAPRSPDEWVTVDVLTGDTSVSEPIDAILCVVNATLLHRSLFLVSQILELGKPVVIAINMADVAESRGLQIDVARLSLALGVPVILTSASRKQGIELLKDTLNKVVVEHSQATRLRPLPEAFYAIRESLRSELDAMVPQAENRVDDYVLERALLDEGSESICRIEKHFGSGSRGAVHAAHKVLCETLGIPADVECNARYAWAAKQLEGALQESNTERVSWTDRLDGVLTHRILGLVIFAATMLGVFQVIYSFAQWPMEWFEMGQDALTEIVCRFIEPGILRSLIVDGIIAGVGGVLIFVPQIALLFLFIAILEDCGYMARAAFLMDRVMSLFGLSGKSFLPLMSSFACAVPGIMATRVIENRRDRLATIMVAPLMSCSARLPVYLLLVFAFVPGTSYLGGWITLPGLVLMSMYLVGVFVAIPVAWILKKSILKGEPAAFVLELPEYKWPALPVVFERVFQSCKAFVIRAGTLIFSATIVIWAAGHFPGNHETQYALEREIESLSEQVTMDEQTEQRLSLLQTEHNQESGRLLEISLLGRSGKIIEPLVKPLGWDWKIGVGAIASFPAREVIIATLGTIYSLGGEVNEENDSLVAALQAAKWPDGRPVYSLPVAISIMVFFALCAQCVSTLFVIRRETNSWSWPIFSFTYMTVLAYLGALLVYQVGIRL